MILLEFINQSSNCFFFSQDLNDNSVMLTDTHIRLNISESTPVGTILTRVNATDADIGLNGKVKRRMIDEIDLLSFFCLRLHRFIIQLVTVFHHPVGWMSSVLVKQREGNR